MEKESTAFEGVRFRIRRISVGRRAELARELMGIVPQFEFAAAGDSAADQLSATELLAKVTAIYFRWGLLEVTGLSIDGEKATPETLISKGPEQLVQEIAQAIREECGLTEEERKN